MNVKNFLQLPITKAFTVVAGRNGLHKPVHNVEILDFEFSPDIELKLVGNKQDSFSFPLCGSHGSICSHRYPKHP